MGSICHCYRKEHWKIINEGNIKTNHKPVYNIKVGEWNDYGSYGDLKVLMLKDVYDKIMSKEYYAISQAYSEEVIVVKDKNGNVVDLLKGGR